MTEIVRQDTKLPYLDKQRVLEMAAIVQKVAPWANGLQAGEIGLVVRRAMGMGVDPLNPHEVQIWKQGGTITIQLAYTLMIEWVRKFKGDYTRPIYYVLHGEQLTEVGLQPGDHAVRVEFFMREDLFRITEMYPIFGEDTPEMFKVVGTGAVTAKDWNGPYFAPNGRSKMWKLEKRALLDAFRLKFGTPTLVEIEELRRDLGHDKITPEAWIGTENLYPGDAVALAKSHAAPPIENGPVEEREEAMAALFPPAKEAPVVVGKITEIIEEPDAEPPEFEGDEAGAQAVAALKAEADAGGRGTPARGRPEWKSKPHAIAWGIAQGVFGEGAEAAPHARNAYDKLKAEHKPGSSSEMFDLWHADVMQRARK